WFAAIPMVFMLIMPAYALGWNMFNERTGWFWPLREMATGVVTWQWSNSHLLFLIGLLTLALQIWMVIEGIIIFKRTRGQLEEPLPPLPARTVTTSAGGSD
ncbi:MAG: carbon starvation protein A, partial [Planctomyces sp.]|nr:carbon starvation protein A [Planctomyces sp.]